MQKNCSFIIAARGSAQNDSKHASYRRVEYLCSPIYTCDPRTHNDYECTDSHSSLKVGD